MLEGTRQRKKLPAQEAIIVLFDEADDHYTLELLLKLLRMISIPPGEKQWVVSELRRLSPKIRDKGVSTHPPVLEETIRAIQEE